MVATSQGQPSLPTETFSPTKQPNNQPPFAYLAGMCQPWLGSQPTVLVSLVTAFLLQGALPRQPSGPVRLLQGPDWFIANVGRGLRLKGPQLCCTKGQDLAEGQKCFLEYAVC